MSVAKAQADYAIAKEKCDDKAGNDRVACVKEARTAQARAKADARGQMPTANLPGSDKSAMVARGRVNLFSLQVPDFPCRTTDYYL